MADATGEGKKLPLRVAFDRRIKLEFHGARITSDGGLLAYRELDDTVGLTTIAALRLAEGRRRKGERKGGGMGQRQDARQAGRAAEIDPTGSAVGGARSRAWRAGAERRVATGSS